MNPDTALVTVNGETLPVRPTMIRPVASPDEALGAWQEFQALKAKLITQDDIQAIQGRNAIKKSGWRKIAAAFALDTELRAEERIPKEVPGTFAFECTVRAIAPSGRHADGVGSCDSTESRFRKSSDHLEHDVRATAYTRACNRAISDLVGGGEVSAEELKADTRPPLSREQAAELLTQFDHSCDTQHVSYDYRTLCVQLLQSADDLRRAFKYFKDQSSPWVEPAGVEDAAEGDDPD